MTPLKWALCVPAFILWLVCLLPAWVCEQTGKFLGFDQL
jgi:hypothetical protein